MNPETLRKIFKSPFDYKTYSNEIVHRLFGCNNVATNPELLDTNADGDKSYFIGQMEDTDGRLLGFFYTRVADGGDVRRKRVGLRKLIQPYLKYDVDGAIAVFDDGNHWRLSYICDLKEGNTAAKRFSYILGDEQGQYKTPIERLGKVEEKNGRFKLSDLREAFSVDALSKEFFDEYHRHYDIIINELKRQGFEGATIHDYVKKMMGRIVFLHFLQKKGWLKGNLAFLRDLFFFSPHQGDFLEQVLEPLFFGIFNTENANREQMFRAKGWDMGLLEDWKELPYLNGGLFERDAVDEQNITLPSSLFEDLFTFMASYNFTVDENDPDDAEVGVDPEMLGKIFESLLEDNKAKGAFYTPKEIVRYMCKESLIAYLATQIDKSQSEQKEKSDSSDGSDCDKYIRAFVETHEMQPELEPYRDSLDTALCEVKICDPAIGSGAFPMGLLNELWRCREALSGSSPKLGEGDRSEGMVEECVTRVELKKEIIENNIYGVDIEKGAIDIARLRFWLSIVVDAEKPEPLPNFDYKFMQGNSLIESFDGHDLSHIMDASPSKSKVKGGQRGMFGDTANQTAMDFTSEDTRSNLRIWLSRYFFLTDHEKKDRYRQHINDCVKSYIRQQGIGTTAEDSLNTLDPSANQEFFLWHTWFKDIFDNAGFDIVIANPPYIKEYENSRAFELLKVGKYYKAKMDIWFYFACISIDILKENGVLSFIAQPQWRTSDAASVMREKICEECRLIHIVDFGTYMVFDNASTQAMVMTLYKTPCMAYDLKFKLNNGVIHNSVELEGFLTSPFAHIEFDKQTYINTSFSFSTDSNASNILSIIRGKGNFTIDKNKEIIQGIIGSPDEAFKLKGIDLSFYSEQEQSYIKPFHTSTLRYYTPQEDLYLLYLSDKNIRLTKDRFPAIYNKLLPYKESLENRREVINGKKSWYSLWWERDESFFIPGPKIVFAARTLGRNFTYTEDAFYASRNCFFIKCRRIDLKYLTALLNSKLMLYYMHHALKHNGELLQLDKVQFLSIPLFVPPIDMQQPIIEKVDLILAIKHRNFMEDTSSLENDIDQQVYALYNLTPEEIAIIEQN